jgi:hypothetical protein
VEIERTVFLIDRNSTIGALTEDLIDTSIESEASIAALRHVAFGPRR